jgi:hypothetical protein
MDLCLSLVAVSSSEVYAVVLETDTPETLYVIIVEFSISSMSYSSREFDIPLTPDSSLMSALIVSTTEVYVWGVTIGFGDTSISSYEPAAGFTYLQTEESDLLISASSTTTTLTTSTLELAIVTSLTPDKT